MGKKILISVDIHHKVKQISICVELKGFLSLQSEMLRHQEVDFDLIEHQ